MTNGKFDSDRRGFPLSSIIMVTTAVACALACVRLDSIRSVMETPRDQGATLAVASFAGTIIGGFIGLRRPTRRARGLLLGTSFGFISGVLLGLILAAPGDPTRVIVAGAVLITTCTVLRWNTP